MKPEIENGSTYYEVLWWEKQRNTYRILTTFSGTILFGYGTYVVISGNNDPSNLCWLGATAGVLGVTTFLSIVKTPAEVEINKTSKWIREAQKEGQILDVDPDNQYQVSLYIDAKKRAQKLRGNNPK